MKEYKELKKIWKMLLKNNLFTFILVSLMTFFMFFALDFAMRYFISNYFPNYSLLSSSPFIFTFSIFVLFVGIMLLLNRKGKIIFFNIYNGFMMLFFIANYFYYAFLKSVIDLSVIGLAGEGATQITSLFSKIKWELIIIILIYIAFMIISNVILKKCDLSRPTYKTFITILIIFILIRVVGIVSLGEYKEKGKMRTMVTPRNIYHDYDDGTRAMKVSGMPEYMWRFVYIYVRNKITEPSKEEKKKEVNKMLKTYGYKHTDNDYTNIFKDKNIIYVMSESIDTYLVTKDIMPTLYKMQQEGWNLNNRYAPTTFGGGKTFSTEFAMLTGMYQPNSENAAYTYRNNTFVYTFPNMFREKGYVSNSIHYNDGNFYNRENMHMSIGFEKHYNGLNKKYNKNFKLYDSELIKTDETYKAIAPDNTKFATLVTTMSAHMPYTNSSGCTEILKKYPEFVNDEDLETSCLQAKAHETDEFFRLLLKRLKEDDKLDDTVIVQVTDHQVYAYSQLYQVKDTKDENLVTKVPVTIWAKDIEGKQIDTLMDTVDILPTLANMFGLDYNPVFSTGTDIFSEEHKGYVFFKDGSWYDGNIYYKPGEKYSKKDEAYIESIVNESNDIIKLNNLILQSDYYKGYKNNK